MTEDETIGRHHRLNEREFEQTLGDSEGYSEGGESEGDSEGGSERDSEAQGRLALLGSQRVGHSLVTKQQQYLKREILIIFETC